MELYAPLSADDAPVCGGRAERRDAPIWSTCTRRADQHGRVLHGAVRQRIIRIAETVQRGRFQAGAVQQGRSHDGGGRQVRRERLLFDHVRTPTQNRRSQDDRESSSIIF